MNLCIQLRVCSHLLPGSATGAGSLHHMHSGGSHLPPPWGLGGGGANVDAEAHPHLAGQAHFHLQAGGTQPEQAQGGHQQGRHLG